MENKYTTTVTLLKYFIDATPAAEEKFVKNQVVIAKEIWWAQGSKEYSKSYYLIIESIEPKFGSYEHLIFSSCDGKGNGKIKYINIQDQFIGNYSRLETSEHHCHKYEWMDLFLIPEYFNINYNCQF